MICYKDMTFCSAKCGFTECRRNWTVEKSDAAIKWWGSSDAPVAFSDFSDNCAYYIPVYVDGVSQ